MRERKAAKVEFGRHENGHLKGAYYATVVLPDGKDVAEIFTDGDMGALSRCARMSGFTGHLSLHEWLKENRPAFFGAAITQGDPYGVVVAMLERLQAFLGLTEKS